MATERCKLALQRLCEIRPQDSRQPAMPIRNAVESFVQLGASFVHELAEAGVGAELEERASHFEKLTEAGGSWDAARTAVRDLLMSLARRLSFSTGCSPEGESSWRFLLATSEDCGRGYVEGRVIEKLTDAERVRWYQAEVQQDADGLLELRKLDAGHKAVLERWRQELWQLSQRSIKDHLFGSFVLRECSRAADPEKGQLAQCRALVGRVAESPTRIIGLAQEAARYLLCIAAEAPPDGSLGPGEDWCHSPQEQIPAEFPFGSLQGKHKATDIGNLPCVRPQARPEGVEGNWQAAGTLDREIGAAAV